MRKRFGVLLSLTVTLLLSQLTVAVAQLSVDRVFPPIAPVGKQTSITAEGKFAQWPPSVFCDRADVQLEAGEKQGAFSVRIGEEAKPGVAWLRFYDDQSASPLIPLMIAPIEVTVEAEPNNKISDAIELQLPAMVAGRLKESGDSDAFRVSLKTGSTLVVSATANQLLQSPMDAVLQISDTKGNVLAQSDDQRGLDPQISFEPPVSQDYLIRIFCFPETPNSTINYAGSASYVYTLQITQGPFVDHVAKVDPSPKPFGFNLNGEATVEVSDATDVSPPTGSVTGALGWDWVDSDDGTKPTLYHEQLDPLSLPVTAFGHLSESGERHRFTIPVKKGVKYRAEVRSKAAGYLVDSELTVLDAASGDELARNDDVKRGNYDAGLEFTPKQEGNIEVRVRDLLDGAGPRHFYRLSVREVKPDFDLTLSSDRHVIGDGETIEVPVSIDRKSGFSGRIRISAVDLPGGISAEPVISEPKGDSSKSVKLKLVATKGEVGHNTFTISGQEVDQEGADSGEKRSATFKLRPAVTLSSFWLTTKPVEKKTGKEE